jgi:peptide/nickel transport system permease protein
MLRRLVRHRSAMVGLALTILLVVVALTAQWIAPHDPLRQDLVRALQPPSLRNPLGTDEFGRDILSRILFGARISIQVGVLVVVLSGTIGVVLGVVAGYFEGWVDQVISRAIEILLAFPALLLTIAAITVLGPSLINALLAIAFANVPRYARIARATVLSQKRREYVEAARTVGAGHLRIMVMHLLPNVLTPIIVLASLGVAGAILTAASLSFLGLGAQPPEPEWGAMLSSGRSYMRRAWWLTFFPGLAIMLTVFGINLFGDGLRDILDPRSKGSS